MKYHLESEQPRTAVLVAGGNDIPNKDLTMNMIEKIANHMIEAGVQCKEEFGVTNVMISSVLPRSDSRYQGNRHWLNGVLRKRCSANGLHFIENDDIVLRQHGHHDGIHLNRAGSDVLSRNLLFAINNVD